MNLRAKKHIDLFAGSFLILLIKPCAELLGRFLRRNHDLRPRDKICVIKMLGGGSLLLALPCLLGLRRQYPKAKICLVTSPSVAPFGEVVGLFDEIHTVDDRSFGRLIFSGIAVWWRIFGVDTILDFEVYSRLSSVFSVLSCARNRIGFYTESSFWRAGITTHLLFFNRSSGTFYFYDQMAELLGASPLTTHECREHLKASAGISTQSVAEPLRSRAKIVGIGHGCSGLSPERMLKPEQWELALTAALSPESELELRFLGVRSEAELADKIIARLQKRFKQASFRNDCGRFSLPETIRAIEDCDELFAIDSALLHIARLLNKKVTSYWGPTDPATLLRPMPGLIEAVNYCKPSCSPCVHLADQAPCGGKNLCIENLFLTESERVFQRPWLVKT